MNIDRWLQRATARLESVDISTARLDCLVLLEDVLNTNRTQLLAHPEQEITEVECQKLDEMVTNRAQHVPLAYIRHKTEFYGREFYVDERVLEPRPESETMIDMLKDIAQAEPLDTVADIGTGSGALAITAKLELPQAQTYAVDIDSGCLDVAQTNTNQHNTTVTLLGGDLLQPFFDQIKKGKSKMKNLALLCNLPYVPDTFQINRAATHEPDLALFGGPDGLDPYRKLFQQLSGQAVRPSHILTESLPPQHASLAEIAGRNGYRLEGSNDFIQHFVPAA